MSDTYFKEMFGLHGKVAVVTGATRGLGQAMALGLAKAGANIVAVGSQLKNLEETMSLLDGMGVSSLAVACDQTKPEEITKVFADTVAKFGRVDILINNAGTIRRAPAVDTADEDWDAVVETNLNGVFRFCRAAGKVMLDQGSGKIINVASLLSFSGGLTVPAYAASKGGVAQLTKALANEWAASNVQVNAIAPGYFNTDNTVNIRNDEARFESISARIPAGRWGEPEDLAGAAVFLSSQAANYVNGHVMLVDGGWMAR